MKTTLFLTLIAIMLGRNVLAQEAFITTWKTDNPGSSADNQVTIPTEGTGYNYTVDWGDGLSDTGVTGDITHTYASAGTYTISITGDFPRIYFNYGQDAYKILTVEQWGDISWTSMNKAFAACKYLTIPAMDSPDLTLVTDMSGMFANTDSLNQSINHWDVSNVENMSGLFGNAKSFNQPLNNWNVGNVTTMRNMFIDAELFNQPIDSWNVANVVTMEQMFAGATSFNQPLNSWDVGNVKYMHSVFYNATSFNQPLNNWNVSSVVDMSGMFSHASSFNHPLGDWDISSVTDMSIMFFQASSFNQPLDNWDVSSVTTMLIMFEQASAFNQSLGSWNVSNVSNMERMLGGTNLSIENYDATLTGWSSLATLQNNVPLGVYNLRFCNSLSERQSIIDRYNWIIDGDQQTCVTGEPNYDFYVDENTENGFVVGSFDVVSHTNQKISFTFNSGNYYDAFRIDSTTQELIINNTEWLNYENNFKYDLSITARAGDDELVIHSSVWVNDLNERPEIQDSTFSLDEFSPAGFVIGSLDAYDDDGDTLEYRILNDTLSDVFFVNTSGELVVENPFALNTHLNPYFNQKIEVSDGEFADTAFIMVQLRKVEGALPAILQRSGAVGFTINDVAYFGLGEKEDTSFFDFYSINVETREVKAMADFPGQARSKAVAFVVNGKGYVGTGNDADNNNLKDFFQYDPQTNQWLQVADLPGEARRGAVAFTLDSIGYVGTGRGISEELADFWKYDPETDTWTEVFGFTGDARQEAVAFALNGKAYVSGGVQYSGGTFQYNDVQEFDPVSGWTEKIFSNIDLNLNGAVAFTLKNHAFIGYGNHGYIARYNPVTNEVKNLGDVFNLDGGSLGPVRTDAISFVLSDTAYFGFGSSGFAPTIYHSDLNKFVIDNNPPTDVSLTPDSINENEPLQTTIGQFQAVDENDEGNHTFELASGDGLNDADNSEFEVVNDELVSSSIFDFEQKSEYSIYVRVTDEYGEFFEKPFIINVTDVNEAPSFAGTTFSIEENSPASSSIGTLTATDPESDPVDFSIVSGDSDRAFYIENGFLKVAKSEALDFESTSQFVLVVRAYDGEIGTEANIVVNLTDVDESPVIADQTFTIDENSANSTQIGEIIVSDPEGAEIELSISSGNESNSFTLSLDNFLVVNDSSRLNYEQSPVFELEITVTDGELTSTATVTINLKNINEAPIVSDSVFDISPVLEKGSLVGNIGAVDPDNDVLTYSIVSDNKEAFSINEVGDILVNNLSASTSNTSITLIVEVNDGQLTSDAEIIINILPPLGLEDISSEVQIYPNPTKELLIIDFGNLSTDSYRFDIIDMTGHTLISGAAENELDVSTLSKGVYILKLNNGPRIITAIFVKE